MIRFTKEGISSSGGVEVPVRQLTSGEILGIWTEVAETTPFETAEELAAFAADHPEFMITDARGPALGFLLLLPWKENEQILQIVTPRRKSPSPGILEHAIDFSDSRQGGLITTLAGAWSLRGYRRYGFQPIQKIYAFLKADHILPPPIEWVGLKRLSEVANEDELRELDQACFVPFWQLSPNELTRTLGTDLSLGIRSGDRLIGYVSSVIYGRQGSIGRLAVHPDFRRQAIGSALLRAMIQRLHGHGMVEIGVTTQAENVPARKLYQSFGFFLSGEFEILGYPHPREHDLWGL